MANSVAVSAQTIFRLSADGTMGEVRLGADAWRVLAQVNGIRTLAEIAKNLNSEQGTVTKAVNELLQSGLLTVETNPSVAVRAVIPGDFFDRTEKEFIRVMGPLGELIIEEEIENLGYSRNEFPRDQIATLVEQVSAHVPDNAKRLKFQQIMLEAIRKL